MDERRKNREGEAAMPKVRVDEQRVAAELFPAKSAIVGKKLDILKDLYTTSPSQPILRTNLARQNGEGGATERACGGGVREGSGEDRFS